MTLARDKTSLDRVCANTKDDRDRHCRCFGCCRDEGIAGRGDDSHATAHNVRHRRRQPIKPAVQPVVLDCYFSILDIAGFAETLAERIRRVERSMLRSGSNECYRGQVLLCPLAGSR
jgi:hypothetical protein